MTSGDVPKNSPHLCPLCSPSFFSPGCLPALLNWGGRRGWGVSSPYFSTLQKQDTSVHTGLWSLRDRKCKVNSVLGAGCVDRRLAGLLQAKSRNAAAHVLPGSRLSLLYNPSSEGTAQPLCSPHPHTNTHSSAHTGASRHVPLHTHTCVHVTKAWLCLYPSHPVGGLALLVAAHAFLCSLTHRPRHLRHKHTPAAPPEPGLLPSFGSHLASGSTATLRGEDSSPSPAIVNSHLA